MKGSIERLRLSLRRSTSLRTRVAIAAALAAAAVVALFAVVTSVLLVNNDAAQLDRRLDAIIDSSVDPNRNTAEPRAILQTVRNPTTQEVVYQRGFQLPPLPVGTSTVTVNGSTTGSVPSSGTSRTATWWCRSASESTASCWTAREFPCIC